MERMMKFSFFANTTPLKCMKRILFILSVAITSGHAQAPVPNPPAAIRQVLDRQVEAWNRGDLDQFMEGYWKSDSILFIGSKVTAGWASTLARYKKSYPTREAMGTLRFEILRMDVLAHDVYLVTGKYFLARAADNPSGIFTLVFRRKEGKWVIVYDHTS
jgi:ketosteroid isomerase-like protein